MITDLATRMPTSKFEFENERGDRLSARLDLPPDGDPAAYALFAHCFTCSKNLAAVGNITRTLAARGIATVRFDFTGLGESEGDFAETHFSSNVEDLIHAARYMEAHLEAPSMLIGHSFGGAAVLRAAEHIPSARAVVTIGAPSSTDHVRRLLRDSEQEIRRRGEAEVSLADRPFKIRAAFLEDLALHRIQEAARNLGRALLILHAPMDDQVGVENAAEIFTAAKHPKSFVSLDDADHLLTNPADSEYAGGVIVAWAARYVGSSGEKHRDRAPSDNRIVARTGQQGYRTEIMANGHALVADEPLSVGGTNGGPTPYNLLAAALGACTTMTLRMYADRKEWPLEEATARLKHSRVHAEDCATCEEADTRIDVLDREIFLTGPIDEAQRERLLEIANRCPVHQTLEGEIRIETRLAAPDAPSPAAGERAV